jgi:DHA2 family multidrug resistance protein
MGVGFLVTAWSLWMMMGFNMQMDGRLVFWSGIVQGFGTGMAYVPLAAMAFATLPGDLRNEGTAMFSLTRNIGSSIGISVVQWMLTSNTQIMHASLSEHVSPYNLANTNPELAAQLASPHGLAAVNAGVTAQSAMIAYIDNFKLMFILTLLALPLLLLVRRSAASKESAYAAME